MGVLAYNVKRKGRGSEAKMERKSAKHIALGGILSALAVVIMCIGGMIPLSTFVCPLLAMLTGYAVFRICGSKTAWCWYAVTSVLSLLLGPDKEAGAVFLFLGYYPFVKPSLERYKLVWVLKLLLFNCAIGIMYFLLLQLFGMAELAAEFSELGLWGGVLTVVLGNVTFILLDCLLTKLTRKF